MQKLIVYALAKNTVKTRSKETGGSPEQNLDEKKL